MHTRPHILLCGEKHVGKSTLIRRLLENCTCPVYGFMTKMDAPAPDGYHDIYIYPAALPIQNRERSAENFISRCDRVHHEIHTEAFDVYGARLISEARPGGILVMDELGFMEAKAPVFTKAVLDALEKDIPVIAAVKARYDVPFLNEVRACEKAQVYHIDETNREELFRSLRERYPFFR